MTSGIEDIAPSRRTTNDRDAVRRHRPEPRPALFFLQHGIQAYARTSAALHIRESVRRQAIVETSELEPAGEPQTLAHRRHGDQLVGEQQATTRTDLWAPHRDAVPLGGLNRHTATEHGRHLWRPRSGSQHHVLGADVAARGDQALNHAGFGLRRQQLRVRCQHHASVGQHGHEARQEETGVEAGIVGVEDRARHPFLQGRFHAPCFVAVDEVIAHAEARFPLGFPALLGELPSAAENLQQAVRLEGAVDAFVRNQLWIQTGAEVSQGRQGRCRSLYGARIAMAQKTHDPAHERRVDVWPRRYRTAAARERSHGLGEHAWRRDRDHMARNDQAGVARGRTGVEIVPFENHDSAALPG